MKLTSASLLAAFSLLAMSSASSADGKKTPFKVVGMASYTGPAMSALSPAGKGFEAYIDYTNQKGGVHGHAIDLEVIDDQSSTSVGGALIKGAIASSPIALAFFGLSTTLAQAKTSVEHAAVAILTGSADDSLIFPEPADNVFMINVSAKQQAEALVQQARQLLGGLKGKKLALALQYTAHNDAVVANIKQMAEPEGFELVAVERFNLGIPSFSSQGARIARAQPDAVLVAAIPGDAPIVVGAISDAGVANAPIIGYAAISSSEVFLKLRLPNFYAYRAFNVGSEVPDLAPKVGDAYKSSMGSSLWTLGWAAGEVLVNALDRCGDDCTGEKLTAVFKKSEPIHAADDVLYGPVAFKEKNHAGLTMVQLYKLTGDKPIPAGAPLSIAD